MSGKRRSKAAAVWVALVIACPLLAAATQTFTYSSDSMNTVLAEGNQQALLSGHARVTTEDLRITADQILLFGKDFVYAQATGSVHVVDAKRGLDLTSDRLFYDRDRKIARVTGNAVMADIKNELVVKGGFIEDRDTDKLTLVQIGVRILKKDLVCRAEFAKYWRDKKLVELSGLPWVSRRSDVYQAERITINLDTEEISLEGEVQGTIQSEKTEQPSTKPVQSPEQQPAPATGPTTPPASGSTPPGTGTAAPAGPAGGTAPGGTPGAAPPPSPPSAPGAGGTGTPGG
ncbi:MAG TPA: LptA/OstA family protein [Spirochaetia bacterium]|nr:LptA/OstA family protein [Spirochaetia bacterium]